MACNCPNELPAIVPTQQINSIISLFKKWGALVNRYIDRCVDRLIERDLVIFGAVLVQGPKWCGKTTTAHRFALVVFHPPFVTASTAANLFYHGCKKRAARNEKFFDPAIFQKCWRGVGEQPTFAEQIVLVTRFSCCNRIL